MDQRIFLGLLVVLLIVVVGLSWGLYACKHPAEDAATTTTSGAATAGGFRRR